MRWQIARTVSPEQFRRRRIMKQNKHLMPDGRTRITEIQDLLIDRYVEQKEALEEGRRCRAMELEFEIKELQHEKEKIKRWAAA
jgi:hypothetical protein